MEKIFIHGADVGVMAGHAIHWYAIARIQGLLPHRMGKTLVAFMTTGTDRCWRTLDHARPVGAVQVMTIRALVPTGMLVQHLGAAAEGSFMASPAPGTLVGRQQGGTVSDMGIVAGDTGVAAVDTLQMAVRMVEGSQNPLMAAQAGIGPLSLAVTGLTIALGEGLMLDAT